MKTSVFQIRTPFCIVNYSSYNFYENVDVSKSKS